ncbi:MAG: hypothetical protein R3C45_00580 [Phycisphaerales bacterium]
MMFLVQRGDRETTRLSDTPEAVSIAFGGTWAAWTIRSSGDTLPWTFHDDKLRVHNVQTGETRTIDATAPVNVQVSGQYVKYDTSAGNKNPSLDLINLSNSSYESRVMVYDTASDTTIMVGDDPGVEYYRDMQSEISGQYVAYVRSFQDPIRTVITNVYPPQPLSPDLRELRLFDLDTMTDILVTEGKGIAGLQIDETTLVWQMLDTSAPNEDDWDLEIFAYDILTDTIRQVTDNNIDDRNPQISGDTIVWTGTLANGEHEIFYETPDVELVLPITPVLSPIVGLPDYDPGTLPTPRYTGGGVVVAVPEPAGAVLVLLSGLVVINRRRSARGVS